MSSLISRVLGLACALLWAPGCTTDPFTGERQVSRTAIGAGVGAVAGAGLGVLIGNESRERRRNAAIGAGIGALTGGAVGVYMDRQEAALRRELQGTGVSVTRMGDNIVLNMPGNVTFATDQADIRSEFYPVLNSVVRVLEEYEKTLIHVSGHTDATGTADWNQRLSERRAGSVAGYLGAQGVQTVRILSQGFAANRDRVARHDVARVPVQQVRGPRHVASQVAVSDDARERTLRVDDAGHAQSFAGYLVDHAGDRCVRLHDGRVVTAVHQLFDAHQPLSELSAGMQARKALLAEALGDEQRHRQRVSERQGRRRAGRRHQVHWARFFRDAAIERDVGCLAEG